MLCHRTIGIVVKTPDWCLDEGVAAALAGVAEVARWAVQVSDTSLS